MSATGSNTLGWLGSSVDVPATPTNAVEKIEWWAVVGDYLGPVKIENSMNYIGVEIMLLSGKEEMATVDIAVVLEGSNRPTPAGWEVPVTLRFFNSGTDVMTATPVYSFSGTTAYNSGSATAACQVGSVDPGTYDITVVGEHTLMNVKRGVVIAAPGISVAMGTLLEGNCNDDNAINGLDFLILKASWLKSSGQPGFDAWADFNHDGVVNGLDFLLLKANWLKASPIEIP